MSDGWPRRRIREAAGRPSDRRFVRAVFSEWKADLRHAWLPRSSRFRQRRRRWPAVTGHGESSSAPIPPADVLTGGLMKRRPLDSGRCRCRSRRRRRCMGSSRGEVRTVLLFGGGAERLQRCSDIMRWTVQDISEHTPRPSWLRLGQRDGKDGFHPSNEYRERRSAMGLRARPGMLATPRTQSLAERECSGRQDTSDTARAGSRTGTVGGQPPQVSECFVAVRLVGTTPGGAGKPRGLAGYVGGANL